MMIGKLKIEWRRPAPELPRRRAVPDREKVLRVALSKLNRLEARAVASILEERIAEVEVQYRQPEMAGSHGDLASCAGASGWLSFALQDFWEAWANARKGGKVKGEKWKGKSGRQGLNGDGVDDGEGEPQVTRGYGV